MIFAHAPPLLAPRISWELFALRPRFSLRTDCFVPRKNFNYIAVHSFLQKHRSYISFGALRISFQEHETGHSSPFPRNITFVYPVLTFSNIPQDKKSVTKNITWKFPRKHQTVNSNPNCARSYLNGFADEQTRLLCRVLIFQKFT